MSLLPKWREAGLCLLLFFIVSSPASADVLDDLRITVPQQRLPAPDFQLPDLNGRMVSFSDFRGRPVLLNFWATFCAPCRKEMPALESLWRAYKDAGFVVLAVAVDRGGAERVKTYVRDGGYSFPVLLDPDGVVRKRYEVEAFPTTYLIGRDGKFTGRAIGARDWAGATARTLLKSLL